MRIIVTGALGHIGSRLIRSLPTALDSPELVLVDDLSAQRYPSLFGLPPMGRYRFHEADVRTVDWDQILQKGDVVIHLAALTDAANSHERHAEMLAVNTEATARLAESCIEHDAALIFPSTTSVYGSQSHVVDEQCPAGDLRPQSPYAESKLLAEHLLNKLVQEKGLRMNIVRLGTIVGPSPGMRFHTAANKFCWQAVNGLPLTIWKTALHQRRPYLELGDAVDALMHLVKTSRFDGALYNVVTRNLTVHDIVTEIQSVIPTTQLSFVDNRIMNQLSYEVLADRIKATGFHPRGDIPQAIRETLTLLQPLSPDRAPRITGVHKLQ